VDSDGLSNFIVHQLEKKKRSGKDPNDIIPLLLSLYCVDFPILTELKLLLKLNIKG